MKEEFEVIDMKRVDESPKAMNAESRLNAFYCSLSFLFVEGYQELVKNAFPAEKIKGSGKLVRKGSLARDFLVSDYHLDGMDITEESGGCGLESAPFSRLYCQAEFSCNRTMKYGNRSTRINKSRCLHAFAGFYKSDRDDRVVIIAKKKIRKSHKTLISSSFLGTFISITSPKVRPLSLRDASTSETESPEATIPLVVTATHLPLYFSTSFGCEDIHSSSCISTAYYSIHNSLANNLKLFACSEGDVAAKLSEQHSQLSLAKENAQLRGELALVKMKDAELEKKNAELEDGLLQLKSELQDLKKLVGGKA